MPDQVPKASACLLGLLFLAGCTTLTAGTATPTPDGDGATSTTSEEPSTGELPSDGAPNVDTPLDISRFVENPCLVLSGAQAQQLNLPATGELADGALGKTCSWFDQRTFQSIDVNMFNKNPEGLTALYRADKDGKYAYFEPLPPGRGLPGRRLRPDRRTKDRILRCRRRHSQ